MLLKPELTPTQIELQAKLETLTLNSTAIWDRELADGPIEAPFLIKIPYLVLCWFLDGVFEGKYVPSRLFYLEVCTAGTTAMAVSLEVAPR